MVYNECPLCGKMASSDDPYVTQTKWKRRKVVTHFHMKCYEQITRRAVNERLQQ